ncbi:DNA repair protein rad50 [Blyttiomyces sp. JEL0837]|nr:DNA repair protein rad50 [Blyttiomyces sp. JEL0837]
MKSDKGKADQLLRDQEEVLAKLETAKQRVNELESGEISKVLETLRNLERTALNSDERLQALVEQYQTSIQGEEDELRSLSSRKDEIRREMASIESQLSRLLTKEGQLRAEAEANERKLRERDAFILEVTRNFDITVDPGNAHSFLSKLQELVDNQVSLQESTQAENQRSEQEILKRLQGVQAKVSSKEESKKMIRKQLETNKAKASESERKIQGMTAQLAEHHAVEAKVTEEEHVVSSLKAEFNLNEAEAKLRKITQELQQSEFSLTKLNDEMSALNMQSDTRARLSLKQTEKKRKESLIKTANRENSLSEAQSKLDGFRKELSTVEANLSISKANWAKKRRELESKMSLLEPLCGGTDFETACDEAEKAYEECVGSEKTHESATLMFNKYLKLYEAKKCCPLCDRGFPSPSEATAFVNKLKALLNKSSNKDQRVADLAEASETRKRFLQMKPVYADSKRLREREIPELKQTVSHCEGEKEHLTAQVIEMESQITTLKGEISSVQEIRKKAEELERLQDELKSIDSDIRQLEADLSITGSTRSVAEVQAEQETLQTKCKNLRRDSDRLNSDLRAKQKEIQSHESKLQELRNKLQQLAFVSMEKERLEGSLQELEVERETLSKDFEVSVLCDTCNAFKGPDNFIQNAERSIRELQPSISEIERELATHRDNSNAIENSISKTIQQLHRYNSQLSSIQKEIQRYIDLNSDRKMQQCSRDKQACQDKLVSLQNTEQEVTERISAIQKSTSEVVIIQRSIADNLKLRELERNLKTIEEDIRKQQGELAKYDSTSVREQRKSLTAKYEKLSDELARLSGEMTQLKEQERRIRRDLEKDYKDIEGRYSDQLIKLKTETLANEDLEKYSKALEAAIMRYHTMKMDEINKIIRELWVNTYKGNDIETIEIRSDNENVKGNRSYNYRVVMIKDQTELDMRGRCSAGQKVLTSLIIRLALAETFCLNCGILALDEPTTNLDRENVESLAESLANIIKLRKNQKNFQLLIITHDEDFMRLLGQSEFADYYWRISKDHNQHSVIERQKIR